MARQRRGGGFRPPELRGTLGTLLRTAAAQVGPLRDALGSALERTAREGRSRVEDAISSARSGGASGGRRNDALAELGEVVLDLIRRGEIDIDELPEVHDVVAHLDELDGNPVYEEHSHGPGGHSHAHGPGSHSHSHSHNEDDEPPAAPPPRNRFDARGSDKGTAKGRNAPRGRDDDGTVSSKTWSPPNRSTSSRPAAAAKPAAPPRVWRPPVDEDEEVEVAARERPAATRPDRHVPLPKDPLRKGGISFEDDDDLADYMHPDDVPPKGGSDGDA